MKELQEQGYIDSQGKIVPKTYVIKYGYRTDMCSLCFMLVIMIVLLGCILNSNPSGMMQPEDQCLLGGIKLDGIRLILFRAVDPNLKDRFPLIFDHIFKTLKPTDRIITGDRCGLF